MLSLARRRAYAEAEAEDLLQEAVVIALRQGRPLSDRAWLQGVMRHVARSANRRVSRLRRRETRCHLESRQVVEPGDTADIPKAFPDSLPAGLRLVLQLSLSGHGRAEIRHLLRLSDEALRQRLVQLRRRVHEAGLSLPDARPSGVLPFGRIRRSLQPAVGQAGNAFGSHDPDGHLFLVGRLTKRHPADTDKRNP